MAILGVSTFQNLFPIDSISLGLTENVQTSRTVGGMSYRAARGARLWVGSISGANSLHADGRQMEALVNKVQQVGNYFNITPLQANMSMRPRLHVSGDALGAVQIDGVQAAGYKVKLRNLPANYNLSIGDYFSFVMNGVHRLYMITDEATANATGFVTVSTNIALTSGALPANGTAVSFISPQVTCAYVDGSYSGITNNPAHSEGFKFSFQQVLRV